MKQNRLYVALAAGWRYLTTAAIVTLLIAFLLFNRLLSLQPGYSQAEVEAAQQSISFSQIVDNPINAPYKVTVRVITSVSHDTLASTRIAAALFGSATLVLFYIAVRQWYARRIAFLATVLFGSSSWFLWTARGGTPDILFPFGILLAALCVYWIAAARGSILSYIAAAVAFAFTIYVPGLLWFVIPTLIFRRTDVFKLGRRLPIFHKFLLAGLLLAMVVAPLTFAILRQPTIGLDFLGLPHTVPHATEVLKNIAALPLALFIHPLSRTPTVLHGLPLVDIFTSVMVVLGAYYYFRYRSLARAKILLCYIVIAIVLLGLGTAVHIAILLPAVYIMAAAGLAVLLGNWLAVFPANPIAKSVGIGLICAVVVISAVYNLRVYFVAWPHNDKVHATYNQTSENLVQ